MNHVSLLVVAAASVLVSCASTSSEGDVSSSIESDRGDVEVLHYDIEIAAPVATVWETMFDPDAYTDWTSPFMEGSYFEGTWAEGARMLFLAPGGSGMVSEIAENRRHEVMSIRHLGFIANGVEDTTSEAVTSWAPSYETYRFESVDGGTVVRVEQESLPGFEALMDQMWPPALARLKALCEAGG